MPHCDAKSESNYYSVPTQEELQLSKVELATPEDLHEVLTCVQRKEISFNGKTASIIELSQPVLSRKLI